MHTAEDRIAGYFKIWVHGHRCVARRRVAREPLARRWLDRGAGIHRWRPLAALVDAVV